MSISPPFRTKLATVLSGTRSTCGLEKSILPLFLQPQSHSNPSVMRSTSPNPFFLEHAALGSVNLVIEPSGTVRRGLYGYDTPKGYLSSFAASLAGVPPTSGGSFYIDFSIDQKKIMHLSIADVAAGRFDPRAVTGRNVLIGAAAFELGDRFPTSVEGLLPGVTLHALSYESLVQGRALVRIHAIFVLPLVALILIFLRLPRVDWTWSRFALPHTVIFFATLAITVALQAGAAVSVDVAPILAAQVLCIGLTTASELKRRALEVIRHELEVARHQALIALVVRDSSDGVIITDETGHIQVFNERAAILLNVQRADRAGVALTSILPDFPASKPETSQTDIAAADGAQLSADYVVKTADGTRTLEVVADQTTYRGRREARASIAEGRKVFAYSLRDVTMRRATERAEKEAKEAAVAANEAKSHFIAVMSHELRTPLNGIIGFSKILREESFGPLGSDNYKTFAADIHNCGQQLLSIVNDILQVARLDAGEVKIQMEDFEIGSVIDACVAECAADIQREGKTIRVAVPPQLRLHADERLLRGALFQLLSNSVKFTRKGDAIEIKVSVPDMHRVRIEVSDTGIGVDPAQLPKLTEAFYQADASLSRSHNGTGLGLYIVKRYVELHGGVLTLQTQKNFFFRARIDLPEACLSQFRDVA